MLSDPGGRFRVVLPAIARVAVLGAVCAAVGWVFGHESGCGWALPASVCCIWGSWCIWLRWATGSSAALATLPNGIGAWSEVFTRLYRQQRASEIASSADRQRAALPPHDQRPAGRHHPDRCLVPDRMVQPGRRAAPAVSLRRDQGLRLTNLVRDPASWPTWVRGASSSVAVFAFDPGPRPRCR